MSKAFEALEKGVVTSIANQIDLLAPPSIIICNFASSQLIVLSTSIKLSPSVP
jgi:hypothetical protein